MQRTLCLRDRRRGRLDPDRRGAHAADHLGTGRGEHRALHQDQRRWCRASPGRRRRTARATTRSTRRPSRCTLTEDGHEQVERPDGGGRAAARGREPVRRRQHPPDASPERGAARPRALQARRRVHRARAARSSSSTSSPGARCRAGAGRTACTRRSRPRKACGCARRTRPSPRSPSRTTSGCTRSSRA